jgi:ubiquinone/menaquinone biosynthesis C-methylase UbiE
MVQSLVLTPVRKAVLKEIRDHFEKTETNSDIQILDMGCGTGQFVYEMASAFSRYRPKILGVDSSAGMIEKAVKKGDAAKFLRADAEKYIPGPQIYDVIVCLNSFPYYTNQERVLDGFFRMMKQGGLLILAQASINSFYDRLAMLCVKLTVSRAHYPGISEMIGLSRRVTGRSPECKKIPLNKFMPTVCMFIWRGSK